MEDFPWEIFKTETLQRLGYDLGIKRDLKKDEAVVFLKAIQRNGLGPALTEQIMKDLTTPGSSQIQQNGINGHAESPSAPIIPRAKEKAAPPTPSRRLSTRKRPAPEHEPLFLEGARTEDEDAEESGNGEQKRKGAKEKEPESISTIAHSTRRKGVKRVRLSDPGPPPARSTRSHGPVPSVSFAIQRTSPRKKTSRLQKRAQVDMKPKESATSAVSSSAKRSTRSSTRPNVLVDDASTDADADGEDEVVDEEVVDRFTGPGAVAAALTRASTESRSTRPPRGKPKSTSAPSRTRKDESASAANTTKSKPRTATTSRARPSNAPASTFAHGPRSTKRTIKQTAKGALLSPSKATSILSRPIRPQVQRRLQALNVKKVKLVPQPKRGNEADEKSETPKEVFDGVVLKKWPVVEPSSVVGDIAMGSDDAGAGNLALQLDEFVANGLAIQNVPAGAGMDIDRDPVLERDDASSLGGSNKENDFSFRNVSESTEGPEIGHLRVGEDDAEGEPEPETDAIMQDGQPQPQPQPQVEEPVQPVQPIVDDTPRSPLQAIPQLIPQPEHIEPQLQQPQFEPQQKPLEPEPQPEIQMELQTEPQPELIFIPQGLL